MTDTTEIAPDVFRICTYVADFDLQFCQFLVRDDEPLLFHTGMRAMFPQVREAVARIVPPESLKWIAFSHFEPDECGSLNDWLALAPESTPVTTQVGSMVFITDFADRPPRAMSEDETLSTGRRRFRLIPTPHLPHGWDAGMLFEETEGTLFCSDLFHQLGNVAPLSDGDVVGPFRDTLTAYQASPLHDYMPYTPRTGAQIDALAQLAPKTCATMHGATFKGNGRTALTELHSVMKEVLGAP